MASVRPLLASFAAEGALVVAWDINDPAQTVAAIEASGGRAVPARCDVSAAPDVAEAASALLREVGLVNILFNNAGTVAGDGPAHRIDPSVAEAILAVNLLGMMNTCRYFLPAMIEAQRGSIVSTSSVGGLVGVATNHAYCASKGGVISYSRALAVACAAQGIRANMVCPGPADRSTGLGGMEWERSRSADVPMGRVADAEEIARAALFLASDEASYITGAVLPVDGGRTAA